MNDDIWAHVCGKPPASRAEVMACEDCKMVWRAHFDPPDLEAPSSPARGIANGCAISSVIWAIIVIFGVILMHGGHP